MFKQPAGFRSNVKHLADNLHTIDEKLVFFRDIAANQKARRLAQILFNSREDRLVVVDVICEETEIFSRKGVNTRGN